MDTLGINPPIVTLPQAPKAQAPAPALPRHEVPVLPLGNGDTSAFDPKDAERQRFEAVQRLSQQVADIFVVSDKTFTIFKDVSGQYVTRFTSLRDGKVTYIPEPNLFRLGGESERPVVKIKA